MRLFKLINVPFLLTVVFFQQTAFSQVPAPDVLNYKLSVNALGIFNNGIAARATLTLIKSDPQILILDLNGFSVDSVLINDSSATFVKTDSTLRISLPGWTSSDDTLQATIVYRGIPARDASWGGFYSQAPYAYTLGVGFSSKPHNFGRAWFPCADNFTDRATYDISIRTGSDYTAVCGGILTDSVTHPDGSRTWRWMLNNPIPTYLAGFAIGKYVFVRYDFASINNRVIPVWLAAEAKDTAALKLSFMRLNNALGCFEEKFGPYLFDRVGYVAVPFNAGAMEHATNIAYPIYALNGTTDYETLMAHELAHHWWGNLATCRTAEDMWLNEGWASYCEALFLECAYGRSVMVSDIQAKLKEVLLYAAKNDGGEFAVSGVPHGQTYGTHVYKKGALMAHTLRSVMGDQAFFDACRSYLGKYTFTDVSSLELRDEFQRFTTADLTQFFDQYIFRKGQYDVVASNMKISGNTVTADLAELSRHKTAGNAAMSLLVTLHFSDNSSQLHAVNLVNGQGQLNTTFPQGKTPVFITVDDEGSYALGHTSQQQTVSKTGVVPFNDVLFSINALEVPSPQDIYVEHHWVGPTVTGSIQTRGIRISRERYWSVKGNFPATFGAYAFFNYDGTALGFADRELLSLTNSEDSLVLLYRSTEIAPWNIVTNVTYQPGGSATDLTGRFWLQKLFPGDYAFGIRDPRMVGLDEAAPAPALSLWPNPAKNELRLMVDPAFSGTRVLVTVYDITGKKLDQQVIMPDYRELSLDVSALKEGMYTVLVESPGGRATGRFVK